MLAEKFAMCGALLRMLNRKLSMAWEKWQSTAADMKMQELALRRGLMRICLLYTSPSPRD